MKTQDCLRLSVLVTARNNPVGKGCWSFTLFSVKFFLHLHSVKHYVTVNSDHLTVVNVGCKVIHAPGGSDVVLDVSALVASHNPESRLVPWAHCIL